MYLLMQEDKLKYTIFQQEEPQETHITADVICTFTFASTYFVDIVILALFPQNHETFQTSKTP